MKAPLLILLLALAAPSSANARKVLVIGDSHSVASFGSRLVSLIGRPGGRVVEVFAACSGAPSWFLPGGSRSSPCGTWFRRWRGEPAAAVDVRRASPTPAITTLVDDDVDLVVIALGTNMADWRQGGVGSLSSAGDLARQAVIRGARCVWVGPPPIPGYPSLSATDAARNRARLDSGLAAEVRGLCSYIRSTTPYNGTDGIHYGSARAEDWAEQVYNDPAFAAALSPLR